MLSGRAPAAVSPPVRPASPEARAPAPRSLRTGPRALGGLALACLLGATLGSCASASGSLRDPDAEMTCRAAQSPQGPLLIRCGRFGLSVLEADPAMDAASVLRVYREVVEAEVGAALLVKELEVEGAPAIRWETPDRVAPRSGLVVVSRSEPRRVITCEVRDAGKTAEARCDEQVARILREGTDGIPRVTPEELAAPGPQGASAPPPTDG